MESKKCKNESEKFFVTIYHNMMDGLRLVLEILKSPSREKRQFINRSYIPNLKELSSSRSGAVFGECDYNDGLKIGFFSYLISRCKCYRPKKTNFMDFCWKLLIFGNSINQFLHNPLLAEV